MQAPDSPHRRKRSRKRSAVLWLAACAVLIAVLLAVYALAGFVALPFAVERYATRYAAEHMAAQLTLADTSFNPFVLRFEAEGVRLSRSRGAPTSQAPPPLLEFERLVVDLDWRSLWRTTWIVSELGLIGSRAHARIGADGALDWAALFARPATNEPGARPALIIEHAFVRNAQFTLVDERTAAPNSPPAALQLDHIDIAAHDLTTFAREDSAPGRYRVSAVIAGGGKLDAHGTLALAPAVQSRGEWALADLNVHAIWPLLRTTSGLELPAVATSLSASSNYSVASPRGATAADSLTLRLDALTLQLGDVTLRAAGADDPLLRLESLDASGGRVDLAAREVELTQLVLNHGAVLLEIDRGGRSNWQALAASTQPASAARHERGASGGPGDSPPWQLRIGALRADNVALHVADRSRAQPLLLDVAAIDGHTALALQLGAAPAQLRLIKLTATLDDVHVAATEPLLAFDTLTLVGAALDSAARRIEVDRIAAHGGRVAVDLGDTPVAGSAQGSDDQAHEQAHESTQTDWHYTIAALSVTGTDLVLRHGGFEPAIAYRAEVASATLHDLVWPAATSTPAAMPLHVDLRLADGGALRVDGTVAPDASRADLELQLERLPLLPLQPLLAQWARVELRSGVFSAEAQLSLRRAAQAAFALRASGGARLDSVRLDAAGSDERLLAWESMRAHGVVFDTQPGAVEIQRIELQQPAAKLVIAADDSFNLSEVVRTDARRKRQPVPASATAKPLPAAAPFEVRIGRIDARDGVLDFADLSLVLPFSTRITALQGSAVDLTTRGERARVQAAGEIGEFGSARITGSLLPFAPKQFMDLNVEMDNVLVPPLSPYTATFAGRKVAQGTLWLDLDYHIENGKLLGDNDIRLADFRLGERVAAPGAFDLPLDLAVALLTNSQGVIELSVPVRGDIGKPAVDVGTLVREALGSVLKRIVTAPFRLLGQLFGAGKDAQQLAQIEFAAGSDVLLPPQREKLQAVARALAERPQLRLRVAGPYAPQSDSEALRRSAARRELAQRLGEPVTTGSDPGLIAFTDESTRHALEAMLESVAGAQALADVQADARAAVPASGTDRYAALFDRIVERYPLPAAALQLLASRRAEAIRDELVARSNVPPGRIGTGRLEAVKAGDAGAVTTTLELDAITATTQPDDSATAQAARR